MLVVFIMQVKARVWMTGPELRSDSQSNGSLCAPCSESSQGVS